VLKTRAMNAKPGEFSVCFNYIIVIMSNNTFFLKFKFKFFFTRNIQSINLNTISIYEMGIIKHYGVK